MLDRVRPGPGQESVWDYPRPPRIVPDERRVRVRMAGETILSTRRSLRVLETSHPPTWYLHPMDFTQDVLRVNRGPSTWCEWKGEATYFDLVLGGLRLERVAWSYLRPEPGFEAIAGYLAIYPSRVDEIYVEDERVRPQPGDFYGGWITSEIVGPFKGGAGTRGW